MINKIFVEFDHDFSEYHANKMKRVQRKVDNLRKAMIGLLFHLFLFLFLFNFILENKKLDEKEMTFFERMRLQMMQNIEIILENFHISYETKSTTKLGHPFSFGFTLHYLKIIVIYHFNIFQKEFFFLRLKLRKNEQNKKARLYIRSVIQRNLFFYNIKI